MTKEARLSGKWQKAVYQAVQDFLLLDELPAPTDGVIKYAVSLENKNSLPKKSGRDRSHEQAQRALETLVANKVLVLVNEQVVLPQSPQSATNR